MSNLCNRSPCRCGCGRNAVAGKRGLSWACWRDMGKRKRFPPLGRAAQGRYAYPPCRHCGRPASRPRGLCHRCYEDPRLRVKVPEARPPTLAEIAVAAAEVRQGWDDKRWRQASGALPEERYTVPLGVRVGE